MKPRSAIVALALALALVAGPNEAKSQERACRSPDPVDTINEMFSAIVACWEPPPGTAGMTLTLQFSIRRNGTLIGKPRATYSRLGNDATLNRAFVASVLEALDKALPLPVSDSMGEAIAGRMLFPRFTAASGSAS
ncbi:MAG: TonB C-terminal domain-containing protein [Mesorhizobium sp.]|nr:MAG: TonB C-terminal domain-containing protein [Mesorhizobium sp.]